MHGKKAEFSEASAFDVFLDYIQSSREDESVYLPHGLHFSTHTSTMFDDITDHDGNILLTEVFRLEALVDGINKVYRECGINKRLEPTKERTNQNDQRGGYVPSKRQVGKIKRLFADDFEIYENAWR